VLLYGGLVSGAHMGVVSVLVDDRPN
jgi:hypothetical protein